MKRRTFTRGLNAAAIGAQAFVSMKGAVTSHLGGPSTDILRLDACGQAELLRTGQISPVELLELVIKRIEELDPKLGFLAGDDFERATKRARTETFSGPFAGVPILLKDTLAYPGIRYSIGSRLFSDQIATQGSEYTKRIDKAGFIVIGKSTTPEFGLVGATETKLEGITRNPWNLEYSPAGSSGGAASAVASGAISIAHGSDGGGSVRIPASACGLFGLKPGRNRTVSTAHVPNTPPASFVVDHCLSRSVRDSALFLAVTERRGRNAEFDPIGFVQEPLRRKLNIAYYDQTLMGEQAHPEVRAAVEETALLLHQLGHNVQEVAPPPVNGKAISDAFFTSVAHSMAQIDNAMRPVIGMPLNETHVESFTLELIEWYRGLPLGSLGKSLEFLKDTAQIIDDYFQHYDVALSPTLRLPPQKVGIFDGLSRAEIIRFTEQFAAYTPIHNQAGIPSMSVPLGFSSQGLPIGSHFATAKGGEGLLLALAYQLEEASPWQHHWPAI